MRLAGSFFLVVILVVIRMRKMSTRHSGLFFLTGLNCISENGHGAQVAAKPMLKSSVTKSKFKPSKSSVKQTVSKKSKNGSEKSERSKKSEKHKKSKKHPKMKASVEPRNKSNARRRKDHVKRSGEYLVTTGQSSKGKMFLIHMKRKTQRRDKHLESKNGDYQLEEAESEYLDGEYSEEGNVIDGGVVECTDCSDISIYDVYDSATELKERLWNIIPYNYLSIVFFLVTFSSFQKYCLVFF